MRCVELMLVKGNRRWLKPPWVTLCSPWKKKESTRSERLLLVLNTTNILLRWLWAVIESRTLTQNTPHNPVQYYGWETVSSNWFFFVGLVVHPLASTKFSIQSLPFFALVFLPLYLGQKNWKCYIRISLLTNMMDSMNISVILEIGLYLSVLHCSSGTNGFIASALFFGHNFLSLKAPIIIRDTYLAIFTGYDLKLIAKLFTFWGSIIFLCIAEEPWQLRDF